MADLQIAMASYDRAVGRLLGKRGVELGD